MTTPEGADAQRDFGDLDVALVRALQADGRASILDLARMLGISRDLASQRVRRLIDEGGVKVVAAVDPGFAGHEVLVHAMLDVEGAAAPIAHRIADYSDAVLVSLVSGMRPIVVEFRHSDLGELDEMLAAVRSIPGVRSIRLTTYVEVLKGFFVSNARKDVSPDPIDIAIIAMLQRDGRTSFKTLSEEVHLSPSSVRERVAKLLDAGVIRISAIRPGGISRSRFSIGLGISARGDLDAIRELILATPAIDFAARTHGSFDFIATVHGHVSGEVLAAVESLRSLAEVASLDSWTHLDLVKEGYARSVGQELQL